MLLLATPSAVKVSHARVLLMATASVTLLATDLLTAAMMSSRPVPLTLEVQYYNNNNYSAV